MPKRNLILNRIQTPDGTILTSEHLNDCKLYTDLNGEIYMADGGTAYLRRYTTKVPYKEMSLYDDEPFEVIRIHIKWGSRGKEGNQPVQFVALKYLEDEHIQAILDTQMHISQRLKSYLISEKTYRIQETDRNFELLSD